MNENIIQTRPEVVRKTSDGLAVPAGYTLKFTLVTAGYDGWCGLILAAAIEWQQEGKRKRPFLTLDIGPFHITSGWLWAEDK